MTDLIGRTLNRLGQELRGRLSMPGDDQYVATTAVWAKRQNPYPERLIGTLRRDCLDRILIFGERHLHRVLTLYSQYYDEARTHLALSKDAPLGRAIQRSGTVIAMPTLSGLHHRYARV